MDAAILKYWTRSSLQLIAVFSILFSISCGKTSDLSEEKFDVVREVNYSFRLQKKRSGSGDAVANLYLPVTQKGRQKLLSYSLSGTIKHKPQLVNDELGNQYLRYEFTDTPQNFVGTVKVKARVGLQIPADNTGLKDDPELNTRSGNQAFLSDIGVLVSEYRENSLSSTENTPCTSRAQDLLAAAKDYKKDYKINSEAVIGIARDDNQDALLTCWVQFSQGENDALIDPAAGKLIDSREVGIRVFKNMEDVESASLQNLLSVVYGLSVDISFEK